MNGHKRVPLAIALVLLCMPFLALGQQQAVSDTSNPMDRFIGEWVLHMKEGPGIPQRESLTVERTESGIKIRHLVAYDNGTTLDYWGVMSPKGDFVQMRQTDGNPMNEEWRILSVDANTLIIETRPFGGKNKYVLSADGKLMKMSKQSTTIMGNRPLPELTFQKSE